MHPIAATVELLGVVRPIGSYGVMLAAGLVIGGTLLVRFAGRAGLDPGLVAALLAPAVLAALFGAHLLSALVTGLQTGDFQRAFATPALTYYGGAGAGVLALVAGARLTGLAPASLLDHAIVPFALAHALGRVGCLLGGCCYGATHDGPLAIRYQHPLAPAADGLLRHPVQAYEAAGLLLLAGLFYFRLPATRPPNRRDGMPAVGARAAGRRSDRPRAGAVADDSASRGDPWRRCLLYVVAYAGLRFGLEFLRADPERGLWWGGHVSTSQLISLALLWFAGYRLVRPPLGRPFLPARSA